VSAVEKIKHLFYLGDVREKLLEIPEKSVQCVVTSPPYWGLRDYGLPPSVWGGSPECEHEWGVDEIYTPVGNAPSNKSKLNKGKGPREGEKYHYSNAIESSRGRFCRKCGAWLGCLGLEPTPELYVKHMVDVFRGVWRVLRDDGTVWLNLGSSMINKTIESNEMVLRND
jgi:DNA modification methylase